MKKYKYYYLSLNHLLSNFTVMMLATTDEPILNYKEELLNESIGDILEYVLPEEEVLPFNLGASLNEKHEYVVYEPSDKELVEAGVKVLNFGEYLSAITNEIEYYNPNQFTVTDGVLYPISREYMIDSGIITMETELSLARRDRDTIMTALDKCNISHLIGDKVLTADRLAVVKAFKQQWLDITTDYTDLSVPILDRAPTMIPEVEYFMPVSRR